jgi:ABC-type multidrug transport system ATPase subunit
MPDTDTPLLEARGLTVVAGQRRLVAELDLELRPGDALAVLGPNGVGKTLTLQTLAGLRKPAAGEIIVAGRAAREPGRAAPSPAGSGCCRRAPKTRFPPRSWKRR